MDILTKIQTELNAPKNLFNSFGKYSYRNCEGILEALKPHLKEHCASIVITDEIVEVSGRVYVKATAILSAKEFRCEASAFAREPENKKGMDESQITGAASSYARKYALNGLFAIDDTKDADATNDHGKSEPVRPTMTKDRAVKLVRGAMNTSDLKSVWSRYGSVFKRELNLDEFAEVELEKDAKKAEFEAAQNG